MRTAATAARYPLTFGVRLRRRCLGLGERGKDRLADLSAYRLDDTEVDACKLALGFIAVCDQRASFGDGSGELTQFVRGDVAALGEGSGE